MTRAQWIAWSLGSAVIVAVFTVARGRAIALGNWTTFDLVFLVIAAAVWILPVAGEVKLLNLIHLKEKAPRTNAERGVIKAQVESSATAAGIGSGAGLLVPTAVGDGGAVVLPQFRDAPPSYAVQAFGIRYSVEQELLKVFARIWPDRLAPSTANRIIELLDAEGVLKPKGFAAALRELMAVTKAAMRGNEPEPSHAEFLRDVGPRIVEFLRQIK